MGNAKLRHKELNLTMPQLKAVQTWFRVQRTKQKQIQQIRWLERDREDHERRLRWRHLSPAAKRLLRRPNAQKTLLEKLPGVVADVLVGINRFTALLVDCSEPLLHFCNYIVGHFGNAHQPPVLGMDCEPSIQMVDVSSLQILCKSPDAPLVYIGCTDLTV